ncbi:Bcl10-interacting CARD protein, partial [Chelonia mydas]
YCDRLRQDMYFLTSNGRLSEHLADKIILQLNRVYPQILTNKEAEKFRNPKASLHIRLSDLISHLQKKGDKHCQEFYRALQINAEQLYNDLPSRKILSPMFFLACFSVAAGLALFMYCWNPVYASPTGRSTSSRHSPAAQLQRQSGEQRLLAGRPALKAVLCQLQHRRVAM